jgi:hypothetical protein
MNNNLRNLQSSIQIALDDSQVTPGQIAEIVRETLRMEASKARDVAMKAEAALSSFEPTISSFGNDDITFSSDIQEAQTISSVSFYGSSGTDVISFS